MGNLFDAVGAGNECFCGYLPTIDVGKLDEQILPISSLKARCYVFILRKTMFISCIVDELEHD